MLSQANISAVIYLIYIDFSYNQFTACIYFIYTPAGKL